MRSLELLLVDGDAALRTLIAALLRVHGYAVRAVPDLEAAARLLARGLRPAVAIVDDDGAEPPWSARLHDLDGGVPVVALTWEPRAARGAADVVLAKPFRSGDLLAAIERVVASAGAETDPTSP